MRRTWLAGAVLSCLMATAAGAQAPATQTASPTAERPTPEPYTYSADGRRDPFLSLLGTGLEPRSASSRAEGAAGLTVGELSVRGIIQSRGVLIAMVQGADNKTYVVHQGDRFADGTLKAITAQELVFVQQVRDPLSLVKQREIHKQLRATEGAKP